MKSLGERISGVAGTILGVMLFGSGIGLLFLTEWYLGLVAAYILPTINVFALIGIAASILLGIPFLIFRKSREWAEIIFAISGLVVGVAVSLWSLLLIFAAWGKFWTLVTLIFLPFTPLLAAIAQATAGHWDIVGMLVLNIAVVLVLFGGASFAGARKPSY